MSEPISLPWRLAVVVLVMIASFYVIAVTRIEHPDMSETRLFLAFWPRWIIVGVLCALGVKLLNETPR